MEPRKEYELKAWANVIVAIVFVIGMTAFFLDHRSATVEWRAGRVIGKEWSGKRWGSNRETSVAFGSSNPSGPQANCSIHVDLGGCKGWVTVDRWAYTDFQVGQSCEVAFRHGRLKDYDFDEIRRPPSEKRLPWF
jgi:hypothetical protein